MRPGQDSLDGGGPGLGGRRGAAGKAEGGEELPLFSALIQHSPDASCLLASTDSLDIESLMAEGEGGKGGGQPGERRDSGSGVSWGAASLSSLTAPDLEGSPLLFSDTEKSDDEWLYAPPAMHSSRALEERRTHSLSAAPSQSARTGATSWHPGSPAGTGRHSPARRHSTGGSVPLGHKAASPASSAGPASSPSPTMSPRPRPGSGGLSGPSSLPLRRFSSSPARRGSGAATPPPLALHPRSPRQPGPAPQRSPSLPAEHRGQRGTSPGRLRASPISPSPSRGTPSPGRRRESSSPGEGGARSPGLLRSQSSADPRLPSPVRPVRRSESFSLSPPRTSFARPALQPLLGAAAAIGAAGAGPTAAPLLHGDARSMAPSPGRGDSQGPLLLELSNETPPNLRTVLPDRPLGAAGGGKGLGGGAGLGLGASRGRQTGVRAHSHGPAPAGKGGRSSSASSVAGGHSTSAGRPRAVPEASSSSTPSWGFSSSSWRGDLRFHEVTSVHALKPRKAASSAPPRIEPLEGAGLPGPSPLPGSQMPSSLEGGGGEDGAVLVAAYEEEEVTSAQTSGFRQGQEAEGAQAAEGGGEGQEASRAAAASPEERSKAAGPTKGRRSKAGSWGADKAGPLHAAKWTAGAGGSSPGNWPPRHLRHLATSGRRGSREGSSYYRESGGAGSSDEGSSWGAGGSDGEGAEGAAEGSEADEEGMLADVEADSDSHQEKGDEAESESVSSEGEALGTGLREREEGPMGQGEEQAGGCGREERDQSGQARAEGAGAASPAEREADGPEAAHPRSQGAPPGEGTTEGREGGGAGAEGEEADAGGQGAAGEPAPEETGRQPLSEATPAGCSAPLGLPAAPVSASDMESSKEDSPRRGPLAEEGGLSVQAAVQETGGSPNGGGGDAAAAGQGRAEGGGSQMPAAEGPAPLLDEAQLQLQRPYVDCGFLGTENSGDSDGSSTLLDEGRLYGDLVGKVKAQIEGWKAEDSTIEELGLDGLSPSTSDLGRRILQEPPLGAHAGLQAQGGGGGQSLGDGDGDGWHLHLVGEGLGAGLQPLQNVGAMGREERGPEEGEGEGKGGEEGVATTRKGEQGEGGRSESEGPRGEGDTREEGASQATVSGGAGDGEAGPALPPSSAREDGGPTVNPSASAHVEVGIEQEGAARPDAGPGLDGGLEKGEGDEKGDSPEEGCPATAGEKAGPPEVDVKSAAPAQARSPPPRRPSAPPPSQPTYAPVPVGVRLASSGFSSTAEQLRRLAMGGSGSTPSASRPGSSAKSNSSDPYEWERSSSMADETLSDISTPSTMQSRSLAVEEATETAVTSSSDVHNVVYGAATAAEDKQEQGEQKGASGPAGAGKGASGDGRLAGAPKAAPPPRPLWSEGPRGKVPLPRGQGKATRRLAAGESKQPMCGCTLL